MKARFHDRIHAGRLLAEALKKYANRPDVIVLGLPRGGVPVAFEVAWALHAPMDVFVVRKLGVPGYDELAMGAIATGNIRVLNKPVIYELNIRDEVIEAVAGSEQEELHRRERAYRGESGAPALEGRTVIVVDDGVATGSTMLAAVEAIRQQHAARIIIAAPTIAASTYRNLTSKADEVVSVMVPAQFHAVGEWYEDFNQTTDDEVRALLAEARSERLLPRASAA